MSIFYFLIQQVMFFAIPLLLVAIGGMFSERSGITNIALEGSMIIGAFAGCSLLLLLGDTCPGQQLFLAAMALGAVSGGLYSLIHAWVSISMSGDQIISGTALNIFAPAFTLFLSRSLYSTTVLHFTDRFRIEKFPLLGRIPVLGEMFFTNCYLSTFIGIGAVIVLSVWISKTRFGLRLSACGEHPEAAASAGVKVSYYRYRGVCISGLLAGMAGLIFVVTTSTEFRGSVAGYGFLALAVLILGQWKPLPILLASLFFSFLKALASSYSGIPVLADLNLPAELIRAVPYVITLFVLAMYSGKGKAPKAVGIPYDDGNHAQKFSKKGAICLAGILAVLVAGRLLLPVSERSGREVSTGLGSDISLTMAQGSNVDDKSFCQQEWEAIVEFTDQNQLTRKYYNAQNDSSNGYYNVISLAIHGGSEVVVVADDVGSYATYVAQEDFPDTKFIQIGDDPHSEDGETFIADNTVVLAFAEQESGFLAGYAAVMDGYRNLGFMGGMAVAPVVRYGYGFVAGAACAAEKLGLAPDAVTVRYTYTGTFRASPEILSIASSWYESGTEVVFACGGMIGNSIIKAAEKTDGKVIGVDVDQSGDSPVVITSAMKDVQSTVYLALEEAMNGKFRGGTRFVATAAENGVRLPLETSRFRTFTKEQYDAVYAELVAKRIDVPTDLTAVSADQLGYDSISVQLVK